MYQYDLHKDHSVWLILFFKAHLLFSHVEQNSKIITFHFVEFIFLNYQNSDTQFSLIFLTQLRKETDKMTVSQSILKKTPQESG